MCPFRVAASAASKCFRRPLAHQPFYGLDYCDKKILTQINSAEKKINTNKRNFTGKEPMRRGLLVWECSFFVDEYM